MWIKIINYFKPNTYSSNIQLLKIRKQKQFDLLKQSKYDQRVLTATIQQLKDLPDTLPTFCARAKHFQYLNALADVNLERILARPGTIPFSVKNQLKVKDMIQTCGYAINASEDNIAKDSCVVVDLLEEHGMTSYIQSNIPQGLWGVESNNRVFGISTNPYDDRFISGGSSGGEAVLVRMCCSAFGVGSDMAGSVRIPASFCGVYSFKPTGSRRLSRRGRLSLTGSEIQVVKDVDPTLGFMTRHVDDLEYLLKLTLGKGLEKDWSVYGEWQRDVYEECVGKKMTIGYMIDLPEVDTAPAIKNAIKDTIAKLTKQGHKVVQFKFDDLVKFRDNINKINATPGIYKTILTKLQGQPIVQHNKQMAVLQSLGNWAISLRALFCKSQQQKKIYQNLKSLSLMEFFGVVTETELLKEKFMTTWNEKEIDVLISPVTPCTALLKGTSKYLVNQLTFCCFQNVLEMPAGVVPITTVKQNQTKYTDNSFYGSLMKQSIEKSEGLPVCIQVTAKPYQDERCLAVMKNISKLVDPIPLPKSFYI